MLLCCCVAGPGTFERKYGITIAPNVLLRCRLGTTTGRNTKEFGAQLVIGANSPQQFYRTYHPRICVLPIQKHGGFRLGHHIESSKSAHWTANVWFSSDEEADEDAGLT
ncbi:hypothetical protein OAM67_00390 [bacterium]|nr:hypothetical protein [bacterium]